MDIFCRIANGEIPSNFVYQDDEVVAILDASPKTLGHVLVMPKEHYETLLEVPSSLLSHVYEVAKKIANAEKKALGAKGFNFIANAGKEAGQSVPHFHLHVIPRYGNDVVSLDESESTVKEDPVKVAKLIKENL